MNLEMQDTAARASDGNVQVISLNALKRGSDSNYHKLEIPVSLTPSSTAASSAAFCSKRVDALALNSNC